MILKLKTNIPLSLSILKNYHYCIINPFYVEILIKNENDGIEKATKLESFGIKHAEVVEKELGKSDRDSLLLLESAELAMRNSELKNWKFVSQIMIDENGGLRKDFDIKYDIKNNLSIPSVDSLKNIISFLIKEGNSSFRECLGFNDKKEKVGRPYMGLQYLIYLKSGFTKELINDFVSVFRSHNDLPFLKSLMKDFEFKTDGLNDLNKKFLGL